MHQLSVPGRNNLKNKKMLVVEHASLSRGPLGAILGFLGALFGFPGPPLGIGHGVQLRPEGAAVFRLGRDRSSNLNASDNLRVEIL